MSIMEMLYHGHIHPYDAIDANMFYDVRFVEAEKKSDELINDLRSRMNDTDQKQLDRIQDVMNEKRSYMEEENFRYGLTLGVMLMQEIYGVYGEKYFSNDN